MAAFIEISDKIADEKIEINLPPSYEKSILRSENTDVTDGSAGAMSIENKRHFHPSVINNENVVVAPIPVSGNVSEISIVEKIKRPIEFKCVDDVSSTSTQQLNGFVHDDIIDSYYKTDDPDEDDESDPLAEQNIDDTILLQPEHRFGKKSN